MPEDKQKTDPGGVPPRGEQSKNDRTESESERKGGRR